MHAHRVAATTQSTYSHKPDTPETQHEAYARTVEPAPAP